MKQWRVGTLSMGASLVLLGVFLFVSQVQGMDVFNTLIAWWPLILVVLGLEILLYVFFSGKGNTFVKYDILSILFVGLLGSVCIALVLFTSTGVMGEIRYAMSSTEQTIELPDVKKSISSGVKRIVVQIGNQPVKIEGTSEKEIHLFGTYRLVLPSEKGEPVKDKAQLDFSSIETAGETMYVTIKEPPERHGFLSSYPDLNLTIVLPRELEVEIRGNHHSIELHAGKLKNNWFIQNEGPVSVYLSQDGDIELSAVTERKTLQGNTSWDSLKVLKPNEGIGVENQAEGGQYEHVAMAKEVDDGKRYKGTIKVGAGTWHLGILNSRDLTVNILEQ